MILLNFDFIIIIIVLVKKSLFISTSSLNIPNKVTASVSSVLGFSFFLSFFFIYLYNNIMTNLMVPIIQYRLGILKVQQKILL